MLKVLKKRYENRIFQTRDRCYKIISVSMSGSEIFIKGKEIKEMECDNINKIVRELRIYFDIANRVRWVLD